MFPQQNLCAPHLYPIYCKLSLSLMFPQQNLVCTSPIPNIFQVVSFSQISPTKPCVNLTYTLFIPSGVFPSGFSNETLCAAQLYHIYSKLSLSLRFPQQNLVYTSPLFIPSGLFPSGFSNKTSCAPHFYSIYSTCPANYIILDFVSLIYLFYLDPNILRSTLFPQYDRPSATPTQNNRQNHSFVYFKFYNFLNVISSS
jgi:hypothetical protein